MHPVPLHRVSILRGFADYLSEVGTPVEKALGSAGLPPSALDDLNLFIPSQRFRQFVVDTALKEGIDSFGFRVGRRFGALSMHPGMNAALQLQPTLYQGLLYAQKYCNQAVSNCKVSIVRPSVGDQAFICHRPSVADVRNAASEQIGWFGLMSLINVVQSFTQSNWQPREIGVMVPHEPHPAILEELPGIRIRLGSPVNYLSIHRSLLSMPPRETATSEIRTELPGDSLRPVGVVETLKDILRAYLREEPVTVDLAATLCGTSKRSLQRGLRRGGTTYSEVLGTVRFEVARDLLVAGRHSVAEIAQLLHYSDPSNFSRAFRRIAGIGPTAFQNFRAAAEPGHQAPH